MTVADDIAAFVISDLASIVSAVDLSGARQVYRGKERANLAKNWTARIVYERDVDLARDQGKVRHLFTIFIRRHGLEKMKEDTKSDLAQDVAKEIENGYDGAISRFDTGVATALVARVRCFRQTGVDIVVRGATRRQELRLEVDTWE